MDKNLNGCKGFLMSLFDDGIYDIVVVEADERPDGSIALGLAVSSGAHRGEVVTLSARGLKRAWFELLASPGTLTVRNGVPNLELD